MQPKVIKTPWYIRALKPIINKLPDRGQTNAYDFLVKCFNIFSALKDLDPDNQQFYRPELEFYLGIIEKTYDKFSLYERGKLSFNEFAQYVLTLTTIYAKASRDGFRLYNTSLIEALNANKALSKRSILMRFFSTNLNEWEKDLLESVDYNVTINDKVILPILQSLLVNDELIDLSDKKREEIRHYMEYIVEDVRIKQVEKTNNLIAPKSETRLESDSANSNARPSNTGIFSHATKTDLQHNLNQNSLNSSNLLSK